MRRRDALIIGGMMATAIAIPPYLRRRPQQSEFDPLPGFDGFRRLRTNIASGGSNVFAGLDETRPVAKPLKRPLRQALFGDTAWPADTLPIAVFGDINCPNCPTFEARLDRLQQRGLTIRIFHHQLPLLGPRSVWGAQVILAATQQGAGEPVRRDLMQRVLKPGQAGARDLALRHSIDAERLYRDAKGAVIAAKLKEAFALGKALGIPGTPGSMIGRTLVIGALPENQLRQLIALELSEGFNIC